MPDDEIVWGGRRRDYGHAESWVWLDRMAGKGWTVPTWPQCYGGAGLTAAEAAIIEEEMARLGCRPALYSIGISMLAPVLFEFGTEEQKAEHLPRLARGEIRWCQGYSEPEAGSDLASLKTRADLRGDAFVVNGHKIWTSHADKADWIFCLVRTDAAAAKTRGISFLLIDMATPRVRTSPIRLISGESPFCEVFFEDVRVPRGNLVGALNDGWSIAKRLLEHERKLISTIGNDQQVGTDSSLEDFAGERVGDLDGRIADPVLRDRVARYQIDSEAFAATLRRLAEENDKHGTELGPRSAMIKYLGTELNKRRYELYLALTGMAGLGWAGAGFTTEDKRIAREWLRSKGNSIEGGSSEIQLNIIAKRLLGLPG